MESSRHSPQPATIDLVRADLAELWTIDFPKSPSRASPRISTPASGASDFIDLDLVEIPTVNALGAKKSRQSDMHLKVLSPTKCGEPKVSHGERSSNRGSRIQNTATVASPVQPRVPQSRRQRRPNNKTARTRPAQSLPGANRVSLARTNTKRSNHSEDVFELSDSTDSERRSRPPKRLAKSPPLKKPTSSVRSARVSNTGVSLPIAKRDHTSGTSEKPAGSLAQENCIRTEKGHSRMAKDADRNQPDLDSNRYRYTDTSTITQPELSPGLRVSVSALAFHTPGVQKELGFPNALESSPLTSLGDETILPANPITTNTSMLSGKPNAGQDKQYIGGSDDQDTGTTNKHLEVGWPTMQHTPRALATQGSFRPGISDAAVSSQKQAMGCSKQGSGHKSSDEQREGVQSSLIPGNQYSPEARSMSPAGAWEQSLAGATPPAVLHRIVTVGATLPSLACRRPLTLLLSYYIAI